MFIAFTASKDVAVFDGEKFRKCTIIEIDDKFAKVTSDPNGVLITVGDTKFVKSIDEETDPDWIRFLIVDFEQASTPDQIIGYTGKNSFYEDLSEPLEPIFFV